MKKIYFLLFIVTIFYCETHAQMAMKDMQCYIHVNETGAIEVLTFKPHSRKDNLYRLDIFYYSSKLENNLMSRLISIKGNIYQIEMPKTKEKCEIKKVTEKNVQFKGADGQYKWFTLVE